MRDFIAFALLSALAVQMLFSAPSASGPKGQTYIAVNVSQELRNSAAEGFNFSYSYFQENSSAECVLARISACNNGIPSQFVCIGYQYYQYYQQQRQNISQSRACPMYIILGEISCAVQEGYCVVTDTRAPLSSMTSSSTTTVNYSPSCQYGYICGIKSDGCAQNGAAYNCPNIPANTYNFTQGSAYAFPTLGPVQQLWDEMVAFMRGIFG